MPSGLVNCLFIYNAMVAAASCLNIEALIYERNIMYFIIFIFTKIVCLPFIRRIIPTIISERHSVRMPLFSVAVIAGYITYLMQLNFFFIARVTLFLGCEAAN